MFQTFDASSAPEQGPPRLAALRGRMQIEGLDGFIVPRADAHQGEYVAPCDARLEWLTGFTGSAGFCVALAEKAGVFVDGRYRVQVKTQVALSDFTPVNWPETTLADWLQTALPNGGIVGFDPWLHTVDEIEKARKALAKTDIILRPSANLVDMLWSDRPAPPQAPFAAYPLENAGQSHGDKLAEIAKGLQAQAQTAAILTLADSIAWLLNIRGRDIERNPITQAFAIVHSDGTCDLYARKGKADHLADHFGDAVRIHGEGAFLPALAGLTGTVLIDPKSCPEIVLSSLSQAEIARDFDPCALPKARKNPVEISGMREAHLRDGAAMVRFLAWLDAEAPKGGLTEVDVVTALEGFRRDTNALLDISFETICGAGEHGAIMHYRVTADSNRAVNPGELLVVDSGGQYIDGTTDITRTIAIGPVGSEERACYTRVLQGMIAISRARFPKGVAGMHLDSLARFPLWTAGQDFDHGTGHGVGAYLCVHEGPQRISRLSDTPLEPGMILSNEPGYYREGAFGIRIENLIVVEQAPALPTGDAQRKLLGFETLTWVPIDRRLVDLDMLSQAECDWIDDYHATTLAKIGPRLDGAALNWLSAACAPL